VVKSFLWRLALLLALITGFACAGGLPAAIVTCNDIGELRGGWACGDHARHRRGRSALPEGSPRDRRVRGMPCAL